MMMLRLASIFLGILFAGAAFAQDMSALLAPTPTVKREALVTGEVVRIGDLVENAGDAGDIAIFRSPDLGQTGAVPMSRVLDAIRPYGLLLVDTAGLSEVLVSRASSTVPAKAFETRITRALAHHYGLGDAASLAITFEREVRDISVEATAQVDLRISRLSYDPRSGRFDVSFEVAGSTATRRLPLRFTGTVVETIEAAVLVRPVGRGEIVKASDVRMERRPRSEAGVDVVGALADAVGLAARAGLRAGQIMRTRDLMKPEIVQRNEQVTLIYESPGMLLTIRGKALEAGAQGDVISVLNIQSKRTVQGVVTGPNRVTVSGIANRTASILPPTGRSAGQFAGE